MQTVSCKSVYKPLTALEQNRRMVCKEGKIAEVLAEYYVKSVVRKATEKISSSGKSEAQQDALYFGNAANRLYNCLFTMIKQD